MLETERLILRLWREEDKEPFARMNANSDVMRYFPKTLSRAESDAAVERYKSHEEKYGYCFWAVEEKQSGDFVGFVGISNSPFEAHFTPCVEIGWRLAPEYWGKGYATEAAHASLKYGFDEVGLDEIVSFTTHNNLPSMAVMERIGMVRKEADDFNHPNLDASHPLCPHVFYRIRREDYRR